MKMKKNVLSAAVLAALGVGSAQAVNLSQDGTGEVLYFPYYTVQGGNKTLISVVNTTDYVKAVKVRFREAYNSREVLDFHLFLSPYDVWVAEVSDNGGDPDTGAASIRVPASETSCTFPVELGKPQTDFLPYAYQGNVVTPQDSGPQTIERTREGYIEMLEMGYGDPTNVILRQAVHGPFHDCLGLRNDRDLIGPLLVDTDGGLFGASAILHAGEGSETNVLVTHLADVFDGVVYTPTGDENPTVNQALPASRVMTNTGVGGAVATIDSVWTRGVDAVSAVIMAETVMNEYGTNPNPAVNGQTSWVVTFPTKRWYVDPAVTGAIVALAPFTEIFPLAPSTYGKSCDEVELSYWDREENQQEIVEEDVSPRPPVGEGITLCYEANVVTINGTNPLASANTVENFNLIFDAGWMRMSFPANPPLVSTDADTYQGLPVIGFRASKKEIGRAHV